MARRPSPPSESSQPQRLQKVLAASGVGSRRKCEELISAGRVEVDGQLVTELGSRVDPATQQIRVDGQLLKAAQPLYFLVNKPAGVVSTNRDPSGRPRVVDLIPTEQRLFTVGRLDRSSEGLMLVTNDGELAHRLAHPRYGIEKTYLVQILGHPEPQTLRKLQQGVHLAEGVVRASSLRIKHRRQKVTDLEIVLREGRNREIRRMLARVGHKVLRLKRVALGPLRLGDLPTGSYRPLTSSELRQLQRIAQQAPGASEQRRVRSKTSAGEGGRPGGRRPKGDRKSAGRGQGTVITFDEPPTKPGAEKPRARRTTKRRRSR